MKNRISELRKDGKISQESLAKAAGISRPHLSEIENNKAEAGGNVMFRIASALGKSVEDIFFADNVV